MSLLILSSCVSVWSPIYDHGLKRILSLHITYSTVNSRFACQPKLVFVNCFPCLVDAEKLTCGILNGTLHVRVAPICPELCKDDLFCQVSDLPFCNVFDGRNVQKICS